MKGILDNKYFTASRLHRVLKELSLKFSEEKFINNYYPNFNSFKGILFLKGNNLFSFNEGVSAIREYIRRADNVLQPCEGGVFTTKFQSKN
jgi:hypothetical protein